MSWTHLVITFLSLCSCFSGCLLIFFIRKIIMNLLLYMCPVISSGKTPWNWIVGSGDIHNLIHSSETTWRVYYFKIINNVGIDFLLNFANTRCIIYFQAKLKWYLIESWHQGYKIPTIFSSNVLYLHFRPSARNSFMDGVSRPGQWPGPIEAISPSPDKGPGWAGPTGHQTGLPG